MSQKFLQLCLRLLVFFIVHQNCEVYSDRPKIKTIDGDLIFEAAFNKNIYLRSNGPKSNVFIGEINVKKINMTTNSDLNENPSNIEKYFQGPNSVLDRLRKLENQPNSMAINYFYNLTILSRRINRLNNRVLQMQSQMNSRINNCQSNPCKHGGICLNLITGYYCLCPSNWEGTDCDLDVNECRNLAHTDLGCQNGATCVNRPGSYECLCKTGWFGLHCTRKEKDCSGGDYEMCGHGVCLTVTSGDGVKCICNQGWTTNATSVACLTDVNECELNQFPRCSVNPTVECINLPGSFRCGQCPPGYEGNGYVCNDIDECLTVPNGGCSPFVSCHNTIGSRICGPCPPGYQGDGVICTWGNSCNINNGGCHPSAICLQKTAEFSGKMVQCICPRGMDMDGDGIGIHGCYIPSRGNLTDDCESDPCGEHGQCHNLRSGYTCICDNGFKGAHCENINNSCESNPCLNGGSCHIDVSSSTGFRCECTALFSGDLCQSHINLCSGLLNQEEGNIFYPLSNTTYSHNARCAWVIHTASDKVINVTFSKFNLEPSPECHYDFLQIHDGRSSASQLIGRFCGNEMPLGGNILSSHNNLYFWFRSDQTVAKEGFALHWTSVKPVCGGEIDASAHGHISSPGSPGKYPPNRDCYWHLTTSFGKRIQLHFFALDIEAHNNCSFDYVAIYDGGHISDPLLERYCNSTQPAPLQSVSSELLIHFHSDAYNSGYGFQITYAPVEGIPGCGGYFTAYRGEIQSPTYSGKYLNNLMCEYKIKTSTGTKIRIKFNSFSLENSFRCKYDYLKVYDGPSSDSRLFGKFCGKTYPKSLTSSSNTLFLKFKTDHTMSLDGFIISYETICQTTIYGDSGIIKSPGYPFNYPENRICEYFINTSPGKAIQLTFQDFDIENTRFFNCTYDNVQIRDGPDVNSTLLGTFCGGSDRIPPTQTSTHNYMYIRFKSDLSISGTGFYANFTTIDTECGGIYRSSTGVINHPSDTETKYKEDQSCTWMIIAPEGMHIELTWNRFTLENQFQPSCRNDYVELFEIGDDNQQNTLGRYCGATSPPSLTSSTNRLTIKFESDSTIQETGFSLTYSFLDENLHCGGMFVKTNGYIYSPGWPNIYEPNKDCFWTITVPFGQQIMLNISEFDLERPIRDKCDLGDYLEIRNGASAAAPLIGKYCGKFKSKRIISTGNSLHLHFHSDFYLSGHGFKIEWDGSITGCGGTLTSINGSISSPNYPNNYNENAECFYRIVTSSGSRIRISFTELDMEVTRNCRDDYVEIFDGRDTNAVSLGKFCSMSPILSNIETTNNYVYIKFRSDIYFGGKGFLLNYYTICHCNISGSYGVIESPGFPNNYPLYSNCLWKIEVPKGNKINITFTHFNVFKSAHNYRPRFYNTYFRIVSSRLSSETCETDYVQIKENVETMISTRLCGSSLPKSLSIQSNTVDIKFVSGGFFSKSGFRLEWVRYGCGGHIQRSFGSLYLDKSLTVAERDMYCEWIIETPMGTNAMISFTDLFMYESKNCTIDAIEVYNGQSVSAPLLSKICHRDISTIQGSSNVLLVKFVKQSSLRNLFFTSHFESFRTGCGGSIKSRTGMIYSKNYPKNYDDNLDCIWIITVPENHRIKLNMLDFDLYSVDDSDETSSCTDLVKIYETPDILHSNYSYRFCPKTNISQIISKSNQLTVQFLTNDYGTAKGFKASYTMICGALITVIYDGIIKNDAFVRNSNDTCTWTLKASDLSQKIKLTITHLSLPKDYSIATNRTCSLTFLRVLDGDTENSPLIDEYCGKKVPPMIVSHGSSLTVQLGSYNGDITGTFSATYSTLSTSCGGVLTSEEGTIASPNFPHSYPSDYDCEWLLRTSPGNKVYIIFEKFDLELSDGCNEDYLEVRENNGSGRIIGVFCGNNIPTSTTTATKLYIKFHSDSKISGGGFLLHYGFLHGTEIVGMTEGEISSPMYPLSYEGKGEYTWRININGHAAIAIRIDQMEIFNKGTTCVNNLVIYDGYNEDAPVLENMCGILLNQIKFLKASSNVMLIKLHLEDSNSGSLFHLSWSQADKEAQSQITDIVNCGLNYTTLVLPGQTFKFSSPNYPKPYEMNSNCVWIFKSESGRHLLLSFKDFSLEETSSCFADHISIYSSNTLEKWTAIKENICENKDTKDVINGSTYFKIIFKSDSSVSTKGFSGLISSMCGSLVSGSFGFIEPTWLDFQNIYSTKIRCEWTIKVRTGRNIQISFQTFNITNDENSCTSYVILRNGETEESPLLADGKYCGYSHENRSIIISSSNSVFVSYVTYNTRILNKFQNFRLRFEELNIECGASSSLDLNHPWEIINSPFYPSVPSPYIECIWTFIGPPGEILRIDFLDRFDIERKSFCTSEFVEIRDGLTDLSPLQGIYCGEKPGTIKTSNNILYIKYSTQIAEPRNGFKANISIDVCGGTISGDHGELKSPGYPHMKVLPYGSICNWKIIGPLALTIKLQIKDLNLPDSEAPCATKLIISEKTVPVNNSITLLKQFCNDDIEMYTTPIESFSNEVIVSLHIGKPNDWEQISESRGFHIAFSTSRPFCGGIVTTPEGYLTTPGYPKLTPLRFCQWRIILPDTARRVRLELLDFDADSQHISIYNDVNFQTLIQKIPDSNYSSSMKVFESSGSSLFLIVWLKPFRSSSHRFKAQFTSNDETLCGGSLNGKIGGLDNPNLDRSYVCKWQYRYRESDQDTQSNTVVINVKFNSSTASDICRFNDARIIIKSVSGNKDIEVIRSVCGVEKDIILRIPTSNIDFTAIKNKNFIINFHIKWEVHPCGGDIFVSEKPVNILNLPLNYSGSIDCAWIIIAPVGNKIELKLDGEFQLGCSEEYIEIRQSLTQLSTVIGDYCKDRVPQYPLTPTFKYIFVQYHSNKNSTKLKLMVKTSTSSCGGVLTRYERQFSSPNFPKSYKNDEECVWEIKAEMGNRISLQFIDRFAIEDRPNCTKDMLILYDWKDNEYMEIAKLCGRNLPPVYNTTFNQMKVLFRSDSDITLDGFRAQWTPICGGNLIASEKEQILYSPGYNEEYLPSLKCEYRISAHGKNIQLKFLSFDIEGTFPLCEYDNVSISSTNNFDTIYQVYCGKELPPPINNVEFVQLTFYTDRYSNRKGFKLAYSLYSCGGEINNSTIISIHKYENNLNCTWSIHAPDNKIVVLKFTYIDIESNLDCYNDFIAAYDGLILDNDKRRALMCGNISSTQIIKSTGHEMILQFVSDSSVTYKGFRVEVSFTYSESEGCGGLINLGQTSRHTIKSPLIGNNFVYENYLDCTWVVKAPDGFIVNVEFISFHISPCSNVNQTALGMSKCDCDYLQIIDGINPDSLDIGTYCGHTLPPQVHSSHNYMSIRLATDGEIASSGFESVLTLKKSICGPSIYTITHKVQVLKSPQYDDGYIPRGLLCSYLLDSHTEKYSTVRVSIKKLDLKTEALDLHKCNNDQLLIKAHPMAHNTSLGKEFLLSSQSNSFFDVSNFYEETFPSSSEFCGNKTSIDLYITGDIHIYVKTTSETIERSYKGFEIEFVYSGFCSRNYSDAQGRIKVIYPTEEEGEDKDCYTLITAPENNTISVYFLAIAPDYYNDNVYLEIYDGDKSSAPSLLKIAKESSGIVTAFSSGRNLLLLNHPESRSIITYDLNYVATDKGRGCGGKLYNVVGRVTSPLYPEIYRNTGTCEWELETPSRTRLKIQFGVFDLGIVCDQNYVQLVDRDDKIISTYCSERPADYTSADNYVKIVFKTNMNNGGMGWVADFVAIV